MQTRTTLNRSFARFPSETCARFFVALLLLISVACGGPAPEDGKSDPSSTPVEGNGPDSQVPPENDPATPSPSPNPEPSPNPSPSPAPGPGPSPAPSPSPTPAPDTTAPLAPVILSPPSQHLSQTNAIVVTGTCEDGASVLLTGSQSDSMSCLNSTFSFTVSKSSDGIYTLNVAQADAAGNMSSTSSVTWTRDTLAPNAPRIEIPTSNPYSSGDGNLALGGVCETSATVQISGATTSSAVCVNGLFSFNLSESTDGTYNYSLSQTDPAGNTSVSSSFQWVLDTTIPATPIITTPSTNPLSSNASSLTLTGSCTTGYLVTMSGDVISSDITSPSGSLVQTCAGNAFTFTVRKSADAHYTFLITQENTTNSYDSAPATFIWHRDTVTPTAPTVTNPSASPFTSSGNLTLKGTCETTATVRLLGDSQQTFVCTSSSFTFSVSAASDGTYNYSLQQVDASGNVSPSTSFQWIRNSASTPVPVIQLPTVSNYLSNSPSLTISGTCVSGNLVTLAGSVLASEVTNPAGSLSRTCVNGSFSFAISKTSDGVYPLNLKQTSTGSGDSALVALEWTLDLTAPDVTLTSTPPNPNVSSVSTFAFTSNDPSSTFECQMDSAEFAACTSPKSVSNLALGAHTFNVRARDAAGNMDSTPASYSWSQASYKAIALYHFNSGNVLSDSSFNSGSDNNALTETNGATAVTGKFGDALRLTASAAQFLSKSSNNALNSLNSVMTFEAQIKMATLPQNSGDSQVVASKSGLAGNYGWEVRVKKQGNNYYLVFVGSLNGTTATEVRSQSIALDTTQFHHIAVTWNKGAVRFYYDGATKGSSTIGTAGSAVLFPNTAPLRIGRTETMTSAVQYFNGALEEIRLSQVLRWTSAFAAPTAEYTAD